MEQHDHAETVARDWLAGALRWERTLAGLRARTTAKPGMLAECPPIPNPRHASDAPRQRSAA
jgi:hypothetical protein